jgi:GTP-binding protein LepA
MSLCIGNKVITNQTYLTTERVELTFDMPWPKLYLDSYDLSPSKGYAS